MEANPLRVDERMRKVPDGVGGLVEVPTKFPTWYEPHTSGGTPMSAALTRAAEILADWCDQHPASFPPVVQHLTDGDPTDGDPIPIAQALQEISTDDGNVILANIHISGIGREQIAYPDPSTVLPDDSARRLFAMSSLLPPSMATEAGRHGYNVTEQSRAFMFNARNEDIVQFFDIGTRPSNLR